MVKPPELISSWSITILPLASMAFDCSKIFGRLHCCAPSLLET
jgi:hypothetical protein